MCRTTSPEPADTSDNDLTVPGETIQTPVSDQRQLRTAAEITDVGRCPVCRTPLVYRMNCLGPYLFCLCGPRPTP